MRNFITSNFTKLVMASCLSFSAYAEKETSKNDSRAEEKKIQGYRIGSAPNKKLLDQIRTHLAQQSNDSKLNINEKKAEPRQKPSAQIIDEEDSLESIPVKAEPRLKPSAQIIDEEDSLESIPVKAEPRLKPSAQIIDEEDSLESIPVKAEPRLKPSAQIIDEEDSLESIPVKAKPRLKPSAQIIDEEDSLESVSLKDESRQKALISTLDKEKQINSLDNKQSLIKAKKLQENIFDNYENILKAIDIFNNPDMSDVKKYKAKNEFNISISKIEENVKELNKIKNLQGDELKELKSIKERINTIIDRCENFKKDLNS